MNLLSIDIDFWNGYNNPALQFTNFIKRTNIQKFTVIESHEEILDIIKDDHYDKIYNIDYHSDLGGFESEQEENTFLDQNTPQDGHWASHVYCRKNSEYIWIMPWRDCFSSDVGNCEPEKHKNPFSVKVQRKYMSWKKVSYRIGKSGLKSIEDKESKGVIILSPHWLDRMWDFEPLLDKFGKNMIDQVYTAKENYDSILCVSSKTIKPFEISREKLLENSK